MLPVRKPGRPLSVCPHPPNKPCGCGGITAAIPRMQRCGCGVDSTPAVPVSAKAESPGSKVTGSPTRRAFHIHKPGTKQTSRIDSASLERIDPSQLNIHPPPPWNATPMPVGNGAFMMLAYPPPITPLPYQPPLSNGPQNPGSGGEYGIPYMIPVQQAGPTSFPSVPLAGSSTALEQQTMSSLGGAQNGANGTSISSTATVNSCCAPTSLGSPRHTPTSSMGSASSAVEAVAVSPCCAPRPPDVNANGLSPSQYRQTFGFQPTADMKPNGAAATSPPMLPQNGPAMPPFMQQAFPAYFHPAGSVVYTYPAQYGTVSSPLQPDQWKQSMSAAIQDQGLPPNLTTLAAAPNHPFGANGVAIPAVTSHMCSCGDDCNCLGCAAHPYNEATKNYVRSAMNSMTERHQSQTFNHGSSAADDGHRSGGGGPDHGPGPEPASPQQAQTPSDASGMSEDQAHLSASDFFFVTYPFDQCGGETTSCPCGDDCQCIGCLIHNSDPAEV